MEPFRNSNEYGMVNEEPEFRVGIRVISGFILILCRVPNRLRVFMVKGVCFSSVLICVHPWLNPMFCVNSYKYNLLYYLLAFRLALCYSPFARGSCASRPTMPRTQGKSGMKTSYLKGSLLIPPLRLRVSAVKNPNLSG